MRTSVAFLGTVGIPNIYGGFESFLEKCTPKISNYAKVIVTCEKRKYNDRNPVWNGVERIFIPIPANGIFSIFHDIYAFFRVVNKSNHIIFLGVSAGIFFPLVRMIGLITNKQIIVNLDGLEWRRSKYSKSIKYFLKISDYLAQIFANKIIIDNEGLRPYILKWSKHKVFCIAYSGDDVGIQSYVNRDTLTTGNLLTICRIEPENNCAMLIEGFKKSGSGKYVFVGNWDKSEYGRLLRKKYKEVQGLAMLNPIYNKEKIHELRSLCEIYLHGHSVGGSNPSLIEMLFYKSNILAYDCIFNRKTAEQDADYFSNSDELSLAIEKYIGKGVKDEKKISERYTSEVIVNKYLEIIGIKTNV
jgi:hypothetical protein